jgi:GTP-binding protein
VSPVFVDEAVIDVRAGNGGDGLMSFHREKLNQKGGPDGGNGGRGASVILVADPRVASLVDFDYESRFSGPHGRPGRDNFGTGPSGKDLRIRVPVGCVVTNVDTGVVYGDLTAPGQELLVAIGGLPGRGNAAFATATRQAPRFCERGLRGERSRLRLELKLLADVGLVGLPNAGKSSFLRAISAAKPKVAAYPFTTLRPELGVYRHDLGESYVVADVPGLIEGAHHGVGLGDVFLRHLERTRVLVHLVDVSLIERQNPVADYDTIRAEVAAYAHGLEDLPELVALTKADIAEDGLVDMVDEELRPRGCRTFRISSVTGKGVRELMGEVVALLRSLPIPYVSAEDAPKRLKRPDPPEVPLSIEGPLEGEDEERSFAVHGSDLELLLERMDLHNPEAVLYLHRKLAEMGVLDELEARGAREGDTVHLCGTELEYVDSAGVRD